MVRKEGRLLSLPCSRIYYIANILEEQRKGKVLDERVSKIGENKSGSKEGRKYRKGGWHTWFQRTFDDRYWLRTICQCASPVFMIKFCHMQRTLFCYLHHEVQARSVHVTTTAIMSLVENPGRTVEKKRK